MPEIINGVAETAGQPPLAYSQTGAGPDVVLIHGALMTREDMVLSLFAALGDSFRVTAFDRPGHGESRRVGLTGSPWRQAEAVHAASRALGLQPAVVVGHSHGGAVALAHALQFPDATPGVVALAPIAFPELRLEHLLFAPRGMPGFGRALNQAASAALDPALLPLAMLVALLSTVIPFSLEMYALPRLPARTFATFTSLEPVFGVLSGLFILGERLTLIQVSGVAMVIVAAAGAAWSSAGRAAQASTSIAEVPPT